MLKITAALLTVALLAGTANATGGQGANMDSCSSSRDCVGYCTLPAYGGAQCYPCESCFQGAADVSGTCPPDCVPTPSPVPAPPPAPASSADVPECGDDVTEDQCQAACTTFEANFEWDEIAFFNFRQCKCTRDPCVPTTSDPTASPTANDGQTSSSCTTESWLNCRTEPEYQNLLYVTIGVCCGCALCCCCAYWLSNMFCFRVEDRGVTAAAQPGAGAYFGMDEPGAGPGGSNQWVHNSSYVPDNQEQVAAF